MEKTFFVTLSYDSKSEEFSDENLANALKYLTEASFLDSVSVSARRAFVPAEIEEKSETIVLH